MKEARKGAAQNLVAVARWPMGDYISDGARCAPAPGKVVGAEGVNDEAQQRPEVLPLRGGRNVLESR